ncbi:MAG: universal stress protein [Bacteroidetes bacterium]|jgi:nucleotide-binding universal stress UspA family protein|nr:universal stress protein [Bacteroidota bacterium]
MPTPQRLLLATDFSDAAHLARDHALHLARRYGAALHVLHVAEVSDVYFETDEDLRQRLRDQMDALFDGADVSGVSVTRTIERGEVAAEGILDYAEAHAIDLVVLGTHGRRGLRRMVMGSVATEVVRRARCPVLAVREHDRPFPDEAVDGILVPLDLSDYSRDALPYAKDLAAQYDGTRLHLLHVFEDLNLPPIYGDVHNPLLSAFPEIREKVEAQMEQWVDAAGGPDVPVTIQVETGPSVGTILDYIAAHGIDLVVLTTHGRSGLERFLLGSVAERVMRQAPCPVYVIPSFAD